MAFYNGYNPEIVKEDVYKYDERVINMPSYPDDGSIKIVDDVVVVKFK